MNMKSIVKKTSILFFSIAIIAGLIIISCVYIINPIPHVNNENIIGMFHPLFSDVYSICIDESGQYYLHTHSCILCYNTAWEYQYSYIYMVNQKSGAILSVTDNGLFIKSDTGIPIATISFDGKLTDIKSKTYLSGTNKPNMAVSNRSGELFTLHTGFMFAKVVNEQGQTIWHSSYFGGIIFNCFVFGVLIGFYLFLLYIYLTNREKKRKKHLQSA